MNDPLQDAIMDPLDARLDEIVQTSDVEPACGRLIGCAGTGKTYTIQHRVADDPGYGMLTSTTGISAVNLGAITLNSALKYFDTQSLRDSYLRGSLTRILTEIARTHRWLIVEEYSMLEDLQLDILYRAVTEVCRRGDDTQLGILLVGDLAQLPPVSGRWCFRAECWPKFVVGTERLTKVWRQDGGLFLDALNLTRAGDGRAAADVLVSAGATWHTSCHTEFDGTTILPKNDMVNRYNVLALARLPGRSLTVASSRWGQQRAEWGQNKRTREWGIPPTLELKTGALVMVQSNTPDFSVVNGDTGHVVAYVPASAADRAHFIVSLIRTGHEENIYKIVRDVSHTNEPEGWRGESVSEDDAGSYIPHPHRCKRARKYVTGQIEYYPLRLAYASTVHKTQSLTLDKVQCDFRDSFMGAPSMLYTALSRCRSLDGLRLVGQPDKFAAQCNVDRQILPWL